MEDAQDPHAYARVYGWLQEKGPYQTFRMFVRAFEISCDFEFHEMVRRETMRIAFSHADAGRPLEELVHPQEEALQHFYNLGWRAELRILESLDTEIFFSDVAPDEDEE